MPGFLRELDVFVLSSRFEGFPLALVEALAAGVPCIATPVGGVGEMVGENGALIVSPESEDALVDAMKTMLSPEGPGGLRRPRAETRRAILDRPHRRKVCRSL